MERAIEFVAALLGVLVYGLPILVVWVVWRLLQRRGERAWRRAGEELGLEVSVSPRVRSLRGELDGVRLDLVWARREGVESGVTGDGQSTGSWASAARFTARPLTGALDVHARGPAIDRLRRSPGSELRPDRAVLKPRSADVWSAERLVRSARRLAAGVNEARRE